MQVHCPNCNALIPAPNMNIAQTIATCPQCNEVFNFASMVPVSKAKSRDKGAAPPKRLMVSETLDQFTVEYPIGWVGASRVWLPILLVIAIVWMVTMIPLHISTFVGIVGLLAILAVGLTNIRIILDHSTLSKVYWPIPIIETRFERKQIAELQLEQGETDLRHVGKSIIFVVLHDGTTQKLMSLRTHLAEYIFHELQQRLGEDAVAEASAQPDVEGSQETIGRERPKSGVLKQ